MKSQDRDKQAVNWLIKVHELLDAELKGLSTELYQLQNKKFKTERDYRRMGEIRKLLPHT